MKTTLKILILGIVVLGSGMSGCVSSKTRSSRDYTTNRSTSTKRMPPPSRSSRDVVSKPKVPPKTTRESSPSERQKTSPRTEIMERQRLVDLAMKFKGTPYQYGGKSPESGFDCSGLVYYTFRQMNYAMVAGSSQQAQLGHRISVDEVGPGDLLFFGNAQRVSHVGIVSYHDGNQMRMVHSSSSRGVVEEDIMGSTYWKSRFLYARNVLSDLPASGQASQ